VDAPINYTFPSLLLLHLRSREDVALLDPPEEDHVVQPSGGGGLLSLLEGVRGGHSKHRASVTAKASDE
jgi:hypothetical protein